MATAQEEVTTGRELNSYTGNAGLGTGEATGYGHFDLSPLQTFALKKYETHLLDYQQQQKDKSALLEKYNDPSLYKFVDPELANQISPYLDKLKELGKMNLQDSPNSDKWYEFHDIYNKVRQLNGEAKTVQDLKDSYKKKAGETADPHEKEQMNGYVKQLAAHKLGDEIPAYNKYFQFDASHTPDLPEASGTMQRVVGDKIQNVKYSFYNPMNAPEKTAKILIEHPEAYESAKDLSHTLQERGGIDELNTAMEDTYNKGLNYNFSELRTRYTPEYDQWLKKNPGATFESFARAMHPDEVKKIYDGHDFLATPVEKIDASTDPGGVDLPGYTYYTDPATGKRYHLNKPDVDLLSIYGATKNHTGRKEEVIKEDLTTKPAEIALKNAQAGAAKALTGLRAEQVNTEKSKQALNASKATKVNKQTATINPLPVSQVPLITREGKLRDIRKDGKVIDRQFIVPSSAIPPELRKTAGLDDKDNSLAYQVRFYHPDGTDLTQKAIDTYNKAKKKNFRGIVDYTLKNGSIVKIIDKNGNIVATTESIDRQTQTINDKVTNKGDEPLGEELPISTDDEQ